MSSTDEQGARAAPEQPCSRKELAGVFLLFASPNGLFACALLLGLAPWSGQGFWLTLMNLYGLLTIAATAVLIGLLMLPWKNTQAEGARCLTLCGIAFVGLSSSCVFCEVTREPAFHLAGRRARPIVEAVEEHLADHGVVPARLEDLVPTYLDQLPARVPPFEVEMGGEGYPWGWRLQTDASLGFLTWDAFYYEAAHDGQSGEWIYFRD